MPRLLCAALALVFGGCVAIETLAPPVTPAMASTARSTAADLENGRRIYVGRCASCHAIDPVAKYTAARWRELIDDMADEAELNAMEKANLLAYLLAARESVVAAGI